MPVSRLPARTIRPPQVPTDNTHSVAANYLMCNGQSLIEKLDGAKYTTESLCAGSRLPK